MNPAELANECYRFLTVVLMEAYERRPVEGDLQEAFVFRHARNVQGIARDVIFLYENKHYVAAQIAVRSMLESMFCVVACKYVPTLPQEKIIAECEEMVVKIERIMRDNPDVDLVEPRDSYKQKAVELRQQFSVTSRNDWNVYNVAQAAKLLEHYTMDYFVHCGYVHASITGIISQEHEATLGASYNTAIACIILTAGHLAMLLPTVDAQKHVDNSARLLGLLS